MPQTTTVKLDPEQLRRFTNALTDLTVGLKNHTAAVNRLSDRLDKMEEVANPPLHTYPTKAELEERYRNGPAEQS